MCLSDQRVDDRLGVLARHSDQHHVTCMTLDQRCDLSVVAATDEITFPVARYRSIFHFRRPLADRYRIRDLSVLTFLLRVVLRTPHGTAASQVLDQLFLQGPAGLYVQRFVDHLM